MMKKVAELYSGKAKTIFSTDDPNHLILLFRDDISAFNGIKLEKFSHKGEINNQFNAFICKKLEAAGIATHFDELLSPAESLVKRLDMIKVECVVRNFTAGSLCKRLGLHEGDPLTPPLLEFFLKSDALGDPLITEDHIRAFGWATPEEVQEMRRITLRVNDILYPMFLETGMLLVDYKLEFGRFQGKLVLGDEISPDGCRIWDAKTRNILDKDRFRKDLGNVIEAYEEVARRLSIPLQLS